MNAYGQLAKPGEVEARYNATARSIATCVRVYVWRKRKGGLAS